MYMSGFIDIFTSHWEVMAHIEQWQVALISQLLLLDNLNPSIVDMAQEAIGHRMAQPATMCSHPGMVLQAWYYRHGNIGMVVLASRSLQK